MKRPRNAAQVTTAIETLAREAVNNMIERGLITQDMRIEATAAERLFGNFILRDIATFEQTGKYPEYVA